MNGAPKQVENVASGSMTPFSVPATLAVYPDRKLNMASAAVSLAIGGITPENCAPLVQAGARQEVAGQLMAKDALDAHAREELGISENAQPKPIQAAFTSAVAFSMGAALPTLAAFLAPAGAIVKAVPAAALVFLLALGALGAWAGGAPLVKPALRVGFWGALAMVVTAGIGALIGKAI